MTLQDKAKVHSVTAEVATWLMIVPYSLLTYGHLSIWLGIPLGALLIAIFSVFWKYFMPFSIHLTYEDGHEVWHVCYLSLRKEKVQYEEQTFDQRSFWMTHQLLLLTLGLCLSFVSPFVSQVYLEKFLLFEHRKAYVSMTTKDF